MLDIYKFQNNNITLIEWYSYWLKNYCKCHIKISTYISYEGYLDNHFIEIGNIKLIDLTIDIMQEFVNSKLINLSVKTVRNMINVLKNCLKQALAYKILNDNPLNYVKIPKNSPKEIIVLNNNQIIELMQKSYNNYYGIMIRLTLSTGLRLGELLGLKWRDINFESKNLYVRRTVNRLKNYDLEQNPNKTKIYITEPKTKKSKRTIPLPQNIINDLFQWKQTQILDLGKKDFCFLNSKENVFEAKTFIRHFNNIINTCSFSHINFHCLRHTFATSALMKGMDVKVLSDILGHYSVSFTLDTYTHVLDDYKRKNMELMNSIYNDNSIDNILLQFRKNNEQYIVFIPSYPQYTYIANSIDDGIQLFKNNIHNMNINISNTHKINLEQNDNDVFVYVKI